MGTRRIHQKGKPTESPAAAAPKLLAAPVRGPAGAQPDTRPVKRLDMVFEGGGVKGVALVGALNAIQDRIDAEAKLPPDHPNKAKFRYTLEGGRVVGTSAGAIIAALHAAGYKPHELRELAFSPEISRFTDTSLLSRIPIIGKPLDVTIGLLVKLGAFKGDYFLDFLRSVLREKGVSTFRDLSLPDIPDEASVPGEEKPPAQYRAYFIASDITRGRMLVLPGDMDVVRYGVAPGNLEVALAVRMSVSVPFFFRPVVLRGSNGVQSYLVDGGLLSNFPVQFFDRPTKASEQASSLTVGIRITRDRYHSIGFPFKAARALYALASTAIEAHDMSDVARQVDRLKWAQVVEINTSAVSVLDFELSPLQKEILYHEGYLAMSRGIDNFLRGAEEAQDARNKALEEIRAERHWVPRPKFSNKDGGMKR